MQVSPFGAYEMGNLSKLGMVAERSDDQELSGFSRLVEQIVINRIRP